VAQVRLHFFDAAVFTQMRGTGPTTGAEIYATNASLPRYFIQLGSKDIRAIIVNAKHAAF